ncbi:hypothetical protein RU09_07965 [Microbacterium sp. MEJ108Y]|uniref:hypothetical protein n=1 Tax=Microbacterium sp. MEJ108Y TaxID=1587523 RepID=UPI0005ACAACA|nr:hypothetical protein [Microbacterium sp. MEJ108Y]KIP92756.1 hypothetical protein RU09_07965 [Microbacterium sp. MEJ108Y]
MAAQIGADFEQMLENIHTLVKSIEAAGVGSRATQIEGLRTNTTAPYLDSASDYAAGLEAMIAELSVNTAAFRDALKAVVDQKQESEQNLSASLAQIAQVVDDPALTPTDHLTSTGSAPAESGPEASSGTTEDDGTESVTY